MKNFKLGIYPWVINSGVIILNVNILVNCIMKEAAKTEMWPMVAKGNSWVVVLFLSSAKVLFLPLDDGCKGV